MGINDTSLFSTFELELDVFENGSQFAGTFASLVFIWCGAILVNSVDSCSCVIVNHWYQPSPSSDL